MPGLRGENWAVEVDYDPPHKPFYFDDEQEAREFYEKHAGDDWGAQLYHFVDGEWEVVERSSDRREWEVMMRVTTDRKVTVRATTKMDAIRAAKKALVNDHNHVAVVSVTDISNPDQKCEYLGCQHTRAAHDSLVIWHTFRQQEQ